MIKVKAKKYNVSKKKYDDIMDSLDADMKIKVLRQKQFLFLFYLQLLWHRHKTTLKLGKTLMSGLMNVSPVIHPTKN